MVGSSQHFGHEMWTSAVFGGSVASSAATFRDLHCGQTRVTFGMWSVFRHFSPVRYDQPQTVQTVQHEHPPIGALQTVQRKPALSIMRSIGDRLVFVMLQTFPRYRRALGAR